MLTEKDYCDKETSRSLKELGFRCGLGEYDCCIYDEAWHDQVDRPLLYEAQKWLREEKKIDVLVYLDDLKGYYYYIRVWEGTWEMAIKHDQLGSKGVAYNVSPEEALLEGIKEAIKHIEII